MSAYTLRCWRESASLILVGKAVAAATTTTSSKTPVITSSQHENKNNANTTSDYKILMLKRSSKMTFFPNFYAFPGGSADKADFSAEWLDILSPSFTSSTSPYSPRESLFRLFSQDSKGNRRAPIFSRQRDPKYSVLPSDIAFRICAIRETFEETGILLARKAGLDPELSLELSNCNSNGDFSQVARRRCKAEIYDMPSDELNEWRQCVLKNADNFIRMCQELDLVPDLTALSEWSNWLTPTTTKSGKRFDTIFFISFVDHLPNVTLEANESSFHMWQTPKEYFSQIFKGSISLGPPQVYELNYMNFSSWEAFHDDVECHPHYHAPQWMGVRTKCKDGLLFVFPGDDKYPKDIDREVATDPVEYPLTKQEFKDTNTLSHLYDPDKIELLRSYPFSSFRAQPLKESIMSLLIQSKL